MGMRAKIVGTGLYVPERVVTNDELAGLMDTSDEWIQPTPTRSPVECRRQSAALAATRPTTS